MDIKKVQPYEKRNLLVEMFKPNKNAWFILCRDLNRELGKISDHDRSGRWLEVWTIFDNGNGIQTSTSLESWSKLGTQLAANVCLHGLIAVRQKVAELEGSPGVTLVLSDPTGGTMAAQQAMAIFAQHGLGGALAYSEPRTSQAVLKYIFSPHLYAKSGDKTFGVDWSAVEIPGADKNDAKHQWCLGVERAVREVIKEIPALCIDAVCFDNYTCNDRLDTLSRAQFKALAKIPGEKLEEALLKAT